MKKWTFRLSWIAVNLAIMALNVFYCIQAFSSALEGEDVFICVCFLMGLIPPGFEIFLLILSFWRGSYFLPDFFFEKDGTRNKTAYWIFEIITPILGFVFIWFLLASLGVNPFVPSVKKLELELIVATSGFLFSSCLFSLIFGVIFRNDGGLKKLI